MKYKNILITGGLGFIGSNFLNYFTSLKTNKKIVCLDKETYAANIELKEKLSNYVEFVKGDICDEKLVKKLFELNNFDLVINFAASSHVDRSLQSHDEFLQTNILGVENLLKNSRYVTNSLFVQISTDEVYGSKNYSNLPSCETDQIICSSIYSASKASAEQIVLAYHKSYQQNFIITRSSNNFGAYQHQEKLIPQTICNILNNKKVPIYGNGLNIRDWISCENNVKAIYYLIENNIVNEIINIGSQNCLTNLDLINKICNIMNVNFSDVTTFVEDRKGHDLRYSLDITKLKSLGYNPSQNFEEDLIKTINFYTRKENNEL